MLFVQFNGLFLNAKKMYLFRYVTELNFQTAENFRDWNLIESNLWAEFAFPKILADLFLYPKRHFYLSENNRHQFPHIKKVRDDISLTEYVRRL